MMKMILKKPYELIFLVALIFNVIGCDSRREEIAQVEILENFTSNLTSEDYPIFFQTMPQEKVSKYLGKGFDLKYVFFISQPDSLEYYFSDKVMSKLIQKVNRYEQISITNEMASEHKLVSDEEIPDFIKGTSIPPTFNYQGFWNVYFLSIPIIYNNRAIVFTDSYGEKGIGIGIRFYIRGNDDEEWKLFAGGAVHSIKEIERTLERSKRFKRN